MTILLVSMILIVFLFFYEGLRVALDVRQGHVNLGMLELVVLVEAAFRTIGFATHFNRTLVVPFNLICISPHPFSLFVLSIALT